WARPWSRCRPPCATCARTTWTWSPSASTCSRPRTTTRCCATGRRRSTRRWRSTATRWASAMSPPGRWCARPTMPTARRPAPGWLPERQRHGHRRPMVPEPSGPAAAPFLFTFPYAAAASLRWNVPAPAGTWPATKTAGRGHSTGNVRPPTAACGPSPRMNSRITAVLFAFLLAVPAVLLARNEAPAQVALAPTADQATTSKLVYGLLSDSRYAYRPRPADDAMSSEIFEGFLESLDGNKQFFTAADIQRFEPYRLRMDDAVRSGDPSPAFAMFAVYRERVAQRVAHARKLLSREPDFSGSERWEYDREEAPWAADAAALDELWRKSVMNDWLRLKLAGKEAAEIRKTLDRRYAQLDRPVEQLKGEDVFSLFLNAYTAAIDPHTNYLTPRTAENFNQAMSLSLEGIGAQLQRQDDVVVIREIIPGGPAA